MNNYILITRTFSEINDESAENGDFSKTGFICKRVKVTFSELVTLMKGHPQCSSSPNNGNICNWYETGFYTSDYSKGIERSEAIHFHKQNTQNCVKYWKLAAKFAGHKITQ